MLEGMVPPLSSSMCKVGQKALGLSEEDNKILKASVEDPRWSSSALRRALIERGFVVGETALLRHRKKECTCARKSK
jgi:hypothetical protein